MTRVYINRLVGGAAVAALVVVGASPLTAQHKTPNEQPVVQPAPTEVLPDGSTSLGTVRIPRAVKADGQPLSAGTYQVRLTAETAKPIVGATEAYERWVEFVSGGEVRGRELVSIVPPSEIERVAKGGGPAPGRSRVQMLNGNDYLRVWINRGGVHYLVHLVPS